MFAGIWEAIKNEGDVIAAIAESLEAFVEKIIAFLKDTLEIPAAE